MTNCKETATPMETNFQIDTEHEEISASYREIIGSMMYVVTTSRPDLMYGIAYLCRVLDKPIEQTWKAAKRMLNYLKGTREIGLEYKKSNNITIEGYSDADWGGHKLDRNSVSGSIIFYPGNPISWFSKKQACMALTTTEAEYIAAALMVQDLINLRRILTNLIIEGKVVLYVDNQGSISMISSYENSKRTKYIDIKKYFIKDVVRKKIIEVKYVSSKDNFTDIITKSLAKDRFIGFRNGICLN